MTPREFWRSTVYEVQLHIKGYQWRYDQQMGMFAHFAAVVANPHYKKKLKGTDLYTPPGERKVVSLEEHKQRFQKAVSLMGPDVIPVRKRAR